NPGAPAGGAYVIGGGGAGLNPANLPAATLINAASTYGPTSSNGTLQTSGSFPFILNSSDNLIGIRFQDELDGNAIHYGWFRVQLSAGLNTLPRNIVEYAYEDQAGVGIPAGAVPGPGSLALLAMGAAGLAKRRRAAVA